MCLLGSPAARFFTSDFLQLRCFCAGVFVFFLHCLVRILVSSHESAVSIETKINQGLFEPMTLGF